MILSKKDSDCKLVIVNCNCGCDEEIKIKKFNHSDNEYYLTIHTSKFSYGQKGIFKQILHRLNISLKMLLGKEYLLTELVLNKKEINELV